MEEPQDVSNTLKREATNESLGLPKDFDPNTVLNSNLPYNATPHSPAAFNQSIGTPITGPNPGRRGNVSINKKQVVLDNSDYVSGVVQDMSGSIDTKKNPYKLMQPYSYNGDYDGANFNKYYTHKNFDKLGFSPYRDNDAVYNPNSTFLDEMGRASGHWISLVGSAGLSALTSWKDIFSGNPMAPDLKAARNMERHMAEGSSTKGGATGFITNNFLNSGYSIGVGLEWLAEEAALGFLTTRSAGALAPETLPAMGASAGRFLKKISGGFSLGKTFARGAEALESYNQLRRVNEMRNFWNSTRTGKALSAAGRVINPLGHTMESLRGIKYATKEYKLVAGVNTFGAFAKDMLDIKAAVSESKLEGGLVVLDSERKMIEEYRKRNNGQEPPGEELYKIRQIAAAEGLRDSYWNLPIILMSNKIMYETVFKHIKPGKVKLGDAMIDESGAFTVFTKDGFKAFKGTFGERISLGAKALVKPRTYGKFIKGYLQANVAEGLQENFQETFSGAAIDQALATYNSDKRGAYESFAGSVLSNFGKQFTAQGAETFLSGLLMGAISSPVMSAVPFTNKILNNYVINKTEYAEYKKQRFEQLKKTEEYLNDFYKNTNKFFSPEMRNAVAQGKIADDLYQAMSYGDYKGSKDAQDAARIEAVYTALRTENYDIMLDKFKEMKNLTPEEMEQAMNLEKGEGQRALDMMDSFVARAEKIKSRFEYVRNNIPNVYDYTQYKEGTEAREAMEVAYHGLEEAKRALIFGYASYDRNIERIEDMVKAISGVSKPLAKVAALEFTNLMDPTSLRREADLLGEEIATMSKMEDTLTAADKKDLEFKKKKKEILEKFDKGMLAAEFAYDEELFETFKQALEAEGYPVDVEQVERDEFGNYVNGTLVHVDPSKPLNEKGAVSIIESSDSTGYLLANGDFVDREDVNPITINYMKQQAEVDGTAEAKEAYREYLQLLAGENNDILMNDKLEESFGLILDWRAKNKENINLVKYINYLNDPRGMLGVASRVTTAFSRLRKESRKATVNRMSKAIKKYETNNGIQELYADGWFVEEKSLADIISAIKLNKDEIPTPKAFIEVSTGETYTEGTPKYDKALEVWNKRLPAIVDSFKKMLDEEEAARIKAEEQAKKLHKVEKTADGRFAVISPEGNIVGEPFVNEEDANKIADELNKATEETEEEEEEETEEEEIKSEVVTPDMPYSEYPEGLKAELDPLFQKYIKDNGLEPDEITDELRDNWLGSVTATRVINKWNAETRKKELEQKLLGKRRAESEPPLLKTVNLPKAKTLNDYTIPELEKMLTKLRADQKAKASPDKESDIEALSKYIAFRKKVAVRTPGSEAQSRALDVIKAVQENVINKDDEDKSYLIDNKAYTRATAVGQMLMEMIYDYKFSPFSTTTEANVINDIVDEVLATNGSIADFMSKLKETAVNEVVLGKYNKRKLDLIEDFLNKKGFTKDNVLKAFDKYAYEETTIRGNNVDRHVRDFFTNGELGTRPSYFSEKAWQQLDKVLNDMRDKFIAMGFVVVANDVTVFDDEALVAGTLDLIIIDKQGNFGIFDLKTGKANKWATYEKPQKGMPSSPAMVENGLQLSIYKRLFENQTGFPVIKVGIIGISVKEDLDGNVLELDAARKDSDGRIATIPISYNPVIEEIIPAREAKPMQKPNTLGTGQASVLVTAQARIKYFTTQLDNIRTKRGVIDNAIRDIDADLEKEADEVERSRKELLDLQTFVDKASPKELKGKKRKIQAEIKRVQSRITELEKNRDNLEQKKAMIQDSRKRLDILENFVLDSIDELSEKDTEDVKVEKKTLKEYLTDIIGDVKTMYSDRAKDVLDRIETIDTRIASLRDNLIKLGMTDALIDLYLENNFNTQYLRDKLASGSLTQEQTESYRALLDNLTKKPGAEFRTEFKTLTRDLSKSYIERAKLQFEYKELIEERDRDNKSTLLLNSRLDFLKEALKALDDKIDAKPKQEAPVQPVEKKPSKEKKEEKPEVNLAEAESYVGKKYIVVSGANEGVTYIVTGVKEDPKLGPVLIVLRDSDDSGFVTQWPLSVLKNNLASKQAPLAEYFGEDEEAPGDVSTKGPKTEPSKGYISFTDNNPELLIQGKKKITNRDNSKFENGRYTIERVNSKTDESTPTDIQITLTRIGLARVNKEGVVPEVRIQGDHFDALKAMGIKSLYSETTKETIIEADEYAKAEGFKDWADFEANNKYSKNFINGKFQRFIYGVSPITTEAPVSTDARADIKRITNAFEPKDNFKSPVDAWGIYTTQDGQPIKPEIYIEIKGNNYTKEELLDIEDPENPAVEETLNEIDRLQKLLDAELATLAEVKPKRTREVTNEEYAKLRTLALPKAIVDKMTDLEIEDALTNFEGPQDSVELIAKYGVPKRKESLTLEESMGLIDAATGENIIELYEYFEKIAAMGKLENAEEVDKYYQDKLASLKSNPAPIDIKVGDVVFIEDKYLVFNDYDYKGDNYVLSNVSTVQGEPTYTFKLVAGNKEIKIKLSEMNDYSMKIVDTKESVEQPEKPITKEEKTSVKDTIEDNGEIDPEQFIDETKRGEQYSKEDPFATYKKKKC